MPGIGLGLGMLFSTQLSPRHDFNDFGVTVDIDPDALSDGVCSTLPNAGSAAGQFTAAGAARPTVLPNYRSGHKAVAFDGIANVMGSSFVGSDVLTAGAYCWLFVVVIDAINTNAAGVYDNDAVISMGSEYLGLHLDNGGGTTYHFDAYHWDGAAKVSQVSVALGTPLLLQQRFDGSKIYGRAGSAAEAAGTAAGNIANIAGPFRLGCEDGVAGFFAGKILRGLCLPNNPSANDLLAMRSRLGSLYGLTV